MKAMKEKIDEPDRQRYSPLQTLLPVRRLSSHSPAGPSADIQKAIVDEARLLGQHDKPIPWYRLASKYCLSIDALQTIFNQTEVDAQRRQQQSALVTKTAERHFDSVLCQCNWEAVASELDIPLIECLDLFDASNSTIQPRSLIESYGGWSTTEMARLKQFLADNYTAGSTVDWKLAGAYMNVDVLECQRVGLGTFHDTLNNVGYRRICEFRESKLSWKNVHQHFLQYPNFTQLRSRWYGLKRKQEGRTNDIIAVEWTDSERELMKDLIDRHVQSTTRSELVSIIQRELPTRSLSDIKPFTRHYAYELTAGCMRVDQRIRLRELVAEYGEDWNRIGKALDVLPSKAQHNWIKCGGYAGDHSAWSLEEIRQLQRLIDSGVKAKEAAKLLGTRSHWAYKEKIKLPNGEVLMLFPSHFWAAADDETLLRMFDGSMMSTAAKWEQAGKAVGRSVIACKRRFKILHHSRKHIQVADDRESLVTSEVQGQFELSSAVDWPQVSQATGLGMRECLELSQYDGGKASWHYDPDSFSQSMVDRMTGFIEEHYPTPTPVSYRAVSNFMWVDMNDCIRIHDMLRGKSNWTEADYERAVALRAQGLTYKEVARHLSPTLTHSSVCNALQFYLSPKIVRKPISADEVEEINRLADEYAGKYPVVETIDKIRTQLNLGNRRGWHSTVSRLLAAHPHYQAKLSGFDYIDLANRIATGQTTTKLAAKELDVPRLALEIHVSDMNSRLFSSAWTEEETRKLLDYVQTCNSKPDCVYFSKLLGTKSSIQCSKKIFHLRHKGILSHIPKV
ncbi:hypothetical protein GGH93_003052 [Coemansia aciculifera]|nr:hypothetical protein GGH93_003052 [Coemansia aciculifera]